MKYLRFALYPLSVLYDLVTRIRNFLYDAGWLESRSYKTPVICVGNLSVGGTGKSPMIELLIGFLMEDYRVGVLSRGYKRDTKGFLELTDTHNARDVGDEPLQIKQKFPSITVAVCEKRRKGIEILKQKCEVILLDDGFQHRKVKPGFSILLTSYNRLFLDDFLLPVGRLRESRAGVKRAQVVVVTKCPSGAPYAYQQEIEYRLRLRTDQRLYFASIDYSEFIINETESIPLDYLADKPFTLVTGIANPGPLVSYLEKQALNFEHLKFSDHHAFTPSEIEDLKTHEIILTTEKDATRLRPLLKKYALYHLPIKTNILNEQEAFLKTTILDYVKGNLRFHR